MYREREGERDLYGDFNHPDSDIRITVTTITINMTMITIATITIFTNIVIKIRSYVICIFKGYSKKNRLFSSGRAHLPSQTLKPSSTQTIKPSNPQTISYESRFWSNYLERTRPGRPRRKRFEKTCACEKQIYFLGKKITPKNK